MSKRERFWWGAAGGFLLIVTIGLKIVHGSTDYQLKPEWTVGYILLGLGVLVAGGIWSASMEGDHPWKCVYHGFTFPLVVAGFTHP